MRILESGQIVFIDSQGDSPRIYGAPILKGKYEVELTPGSKRVEISSRLSESPAGDPGANLRELLPARYNADSTLTADIAANPKDLDFDLTSGE